MSEEEQNRFSLRKLSIGLASVLVGVSIFGTSQTVKADTVANNQTSSVTSNAQSSDTQENKNVAKSSFSSDNQANNVKSNLIQTQVEGKNEQKQVQTENGQQDSVSKTQEANDSNDLQQKDAEKSVVRTSSLQESDNQSNDHTEDNSQTQTSQKLDLTKNSKKFAKKVLATNLNLIETTSSTTTNGGFDEATWGKLDVTKWQGSVQDGVYQLTGYTGDPSHVIVPNESDFEKAGKSTNGLQVGIDSDTAHSLSLRPNQEQTTIAFSKTNNQKVKAIGTNWSHAFSDASLSKFDGSNLDVSNVTDMSYMFGDMYSSNPISDLTSLGNWDTSKVTNMSEMFFGNSISDLTPLAHWNTSNVTDMSNMFYGNKVSDLTPLAHWDISGVTNMNGMFSGNTISNLTPLAHWNTSNVTNMQAMFARNKISDLTPLTHWDTSKVVVMSSMFAGNSDLIDLRPIANWNISSITNNFNGFWGLGGRFSGLAFLFVGDTKLNLTNINNTPLMQGFLKTPDALLGATFITNNTDLVKAVVGQDLPTLTNTAKRTIVFNIPHAAQETVTQHIYYKAIAPVQIEWPAPSRPTPPAGGSSAGDGSVAINMMVVNPPLLAEKTPIQADPDNPNPVDPNGPKIVKTYSAKDLKASDWQLDTSKQNDAIIVNGQIHFKPVKIPHVNGYKAYIVPDKPNSASFTVSFMAVPTENKPSTPVEATPSKPSAPTDNSSNSAWTDLKHKVVNTLNQSDSGWTMPENNSTYTVKVPADDAIIDLSDLVIAEPVHAQTRTQIHVNKHFKLSKKHAIKHLKHRKKAVKSFKKYRL